MNRFDFFDRKFRIGPFTISPVFQPTVSTRTKKIAGFEILSRFYSDHAKEFVSTQKGLEALSTNQQIALLQNMHALALFAQESLATETSTHPVPISINVPLILVESGRAFDIFKTTPENRRRLIKIELLEQGVSDWLRFNREIEKFKRIKIGVYVDDFGSLEEHWKFLLLPSASIEKIKFDRLFVPKRSEEAGNSRTTRLTMVVGGMGSSGVVAKKGVGRESSDQKNAYNVHFLEAWSLWAKENHIRTSIEGVEEAWEYHKISRYVDEVQGYYTGRPAPLSTWLLHFSGES